MNHITLRRRGFNVVNDNKITTTILNGYTDTNGAVRVSGNWKTAKIVFEKPVYVSTIKSSSSSISYSAAVIAKNENGSIIARNAMRPVPITLSVNGYVKEIHSSFQGSGYCEVDDNRIWDSSW